MPDQGPTLIPLGHMQTETVSVPLKMHVVHLICLPFIFRQDSDELQMINVVTTMAFFEMKMGAGMEVGRAGPGLLWFRAGSAPGQR